MTLLQKAQQIFTAPGWVIAKVESDTVLCERPDGSGMILKSKGSRWIGQTADPALRDDIHDEFPDTKRSERTGMYYVEGEL